MPIIVDKECPKITINIDGVPTEINNVYVEYTIPDKIKKLITIEFLTEFRKQLYRMHEYYYLDQFAESSVIMNTSTSGWVAAFGKACLNTKNEELLKYWYYLPWYDSDIFDGEITEMLIPNHLILNDTNIVAKKYIPNLLDEDIIMCDKCYNLYHAANLDIIDKKDEDSLLFEEEIPHICHKCNGKNENIITIEDELISTVGSYKLLISKELCIKEHDIFKCSKCNHLYTKDMGSFIDKNFVCDYCNDYAKNMEHHATDYYREVLKELDNWKEKNIIKDN